MDCSKNLQEQITRLERQITNYRRTEKEYYSIRPSRQPFCPRFHYYGKTKAVQMTRKVETLGDIRMGFGSALHNICQREAGKTGLLYGIWECSICGWSHEGTIHEAQVKKCKCYRPLQYKELSFHNEEINQKGFIDGLVLVDDLAVIWEIKSTSNDFLRRLRKPFRSAELQAHQYVSPFREKAEALGKKLTHIWYLYLGRDPNESEERMECKSFLLPIDENILICQDYLIKVAFNAVEKGIEPFGVCRQPGKGIYNCIFTDHCFRNGNPFPTEDAAVQWLNYYWPENDNALTDFKFL